MAVELVEYIDHSIKDNVNILLSSFGEYGIRKSELKSEIIVTIINEIVDGFGIGQAFAIGAFFKQLEDIYKSDSQFDMYNNGEIDDLISEEESYIINNYKFL